MKAAVVSQALKRKGIEEYLIHTGQHYDPMLSGSLFAELGLSEPERNLGVGSGSHAVQTGKMMIGLESALDDLAFRPDAMLIYGDTNSTLAAALVAAKMNIPIAHVEAGLRSFNRQMPEELNRLVTDRLSTWLFCPTPGAVEQLAQEGQTERVYLTGDVMYDATVLFSEGAQDEFSYMEDGEFAIMTLHRAENTDDAQRIAGIMTGLASLDIPILFPVHPRTRRAINRVTVPSNVRLVEPIGYRSMLSVVRRSRVVLTDSGGLQKEAIWLGTQCVTMRDETEWTDTLLGGWNRLVGADPTRLRDAVMTKPEGPAPQFGRLEEQLASDCIAEVLTG